MGARRRWLWFVAVGLAVMLLAACSSKNVPDTWNITMVDFQFQPSEIRVKAGHTVTLTFTNQGEHEHEILIGRSLIREEGQAAGFQEDFFAYGKIKIEVSGKDYKLGSPEEIADEGWHVEVEPGGSVTLTFTVPEDKVGEWEMACFIPGHYESGMHGKFIVVP